MPTSIPTRGERNNNPGNIERNRTIWQGMSEDQQKDNRFVRFNSAFWGIRALAKVLISYARIYNGTPGDIDTIKEIITRWAPSNENNTIAYVEAVGKATGISTTIHIDILDATILRKLVVAIIMHENGRCLYASDEIALAIAAAIRR